MEDVQINIKTYPFEGQPNIAEVKFNNEKTIKVYELITDPQTKVSAVPDITKVILELFPELLTLSKSESAAKSVCAKIVSRGETIVQCLNCRMDQSCIICLNCFKNGNHEGHKILYKKAYGGCCDCGDAEAWNPQGFCKQHSGEIQDVKIQQPCLQKFCSIMEDLFYIYFRLKLRKQNQNFETVTLICLKNVFQKIIEEGQKGIKLLALFLQKKLPVNLKYNKILEQQSIIYNIFTSSFLGRDLKFWESVFINMFPYYEFKKVLLSTYVQKYAELYISEEACMIGQSLSCQILTSYKLVEDYIDSPNSQPIGYNIQGISDPDHINIVTSMMCTDLQKIIKLQDPVPEKYIRLQALKGMSLIFRSQEVINQEMSKEKQSVKKANEKIDSKKSKKKKKKQTQTPQGEHAFFNPILFMIRNVRQIFNQYTSLQLLNSLLRIIKNDHLSLMRILREFASLIEGSSEELAIFRPYDRAFALTLFALCGENLEKLLEFEFKRELIQKLDKTQNSFEFWLKRIQQRMLKTYLFYTHILCNEDRGYHSSFFNYIYLYRSKDNFLISIDTLQLKMIALLSRTPSVLDYPSLMRFEDFDQNKWSLNILNNLYQDLQLLYVGNLSEIYIRHYQLTDKQCNIETRKDVIQYLAKYFVGEGNSATLEKASQFSRAFLFNNTEFLKKCLVQCCNYIRDRKIFELKQEYRNEKPFNYKDFQLRLKDDKFFTNKNTEYSQAFLTHELINGYNRVILSYYWNDSNIEAIKKVMIDLYEEEKSGSHDKRVMLAVLICKFCSTLRAFGSPEQQQIVKEILSRVQFAPEIKLELSQYKDIIGEQEGKSENKIKDKKDLLMLKKMKKMEQLKKKKQENMSAIREIHKIEEEEVALNQQFCAICRNQQNQKSQLVFLVNLNIRNLQKLAKIGQGVQTASFTTCYHIFDYACLQKQCKNEYEAGLKCPICRKGGNIFFPAYPLVDQQKSRPYVKACIERVTQVMMTIHSYREIDPIQQLLKSFYHLILLSQFELEYVRKSRLRLYRIILDIFSHSEVQKQLPALIQKFTSNEISLNPKLLKKDKVNIINLKEVGQTFIEDDQSDSEYEQSQSLIMVQFVTNKKSSKKQEKSKNKVKVDLPNHFKYLGLRILMHAISNASALLTKQHPLELSEKEKIQKQPLFDQKQMNTQNLPLEDNVRELLNVQILPQVPIQIQSIVQQLLGPTGKINNQALKPIRLEFIDLPPTFHWDMSKNQCDVCHEPCHDLFACLLCTWKGCVNCKPGGVSKHFPVIHGETSAFLRVRDGVIYIIGTKLIKKIGCLYLNQWGEPLSLAKQWSNYYLQNDVLEKARSLLLKDE